MLDDQQFRNEASKALETLQRALEAAMDVHEFDVDSKEGALAIEFEDPPAKFIVSPNSPVRQIWVSARVRSFKLDWSPTLGTFSLADGRTLTQLIADVVGEQLGTTVKL